MRCITVLLITWERASGFSFLQGCENNLQRRGQLGLELARRLECRLAPKTEE